VAFVAPHPKQTVLTNQRFLSELVAHVSARTGHCQFSKVATGTELDQAKLRMFEPREDDLRAALNAVAHDLQHDEPDMAAELYTLCGRHAFALEQLNTRLSKDILALSRAASNAARMRVADTVQALSLRAHELKQGCVPVAKCADARYITLGCFSCTAPLSRRRSSRTRANAGLVPGARPKPSVDPTGWPSRSQRLTQGV
jgi:hypothetical protein